MPLVVNFTTSQTLGLPSKITLTDTSTGTDVAVVARRVTLTDNKGVTYVQSGTTTSYETWSDFPSTTSITLDVLSQDRALNVKVEWVNSSGTVLYTKTILQYYVLYAKTVYLNAIKAQSSNNSLKEHANFYKTLNKLLVSIKEAEDSVLLLLDIGSSQAAMNRAKKIVDNPNYFY